jgi:ferritin-like metal-binding protein YciE
MTDPRELFLRELGDVLFVEQTLARVLPELRSESSDEELARGFGEHLEETRVHARNVQAAFAEMAEPARTEACPGIEGLRREHDEFVAREEPSADILDIFNTGSGARSEHYEIAAYTGLVIAARALGETRVAELLEENLRDEEMMLERLETIAERLARQAPAAAG